MVFKEDLTIRYLTTSKRETIEEVMFQAGGECVRLGHDVKVFEEVEGSQYGRSLESTGESCRT